MQYLKLFFDIFYKFDSRFLGENDQSNNVSVFCNLSKQTLKHSSPSVVSVGHTEWWTQTSQSQALAWKRPLKTEKELKGEFIRLM